MMRPLSALLILTTVIACCQAESFSIPDNCDQACSFRVSWASKGDQVEFDVFAAVERGIWAGIGFSRDQMMTGSDAVVAWMTPAGLMAVTDRFLFGKSPKAVPVDETNNLEVTSFSQTEKNLTFSFTRDIVTGDSEDLDLDEPFYLLYAYGGNGGSDGNFITKHTTRGIVPNMITLGKSPEPSTFSTAMVMPVPSTVTSQTAPGTTTTAEIPTTASTTIRTTMSLMPPVTEATVSDIMKSTPMDATQVTATVNQRVLVTDKEETGIEDLINIEEGPIENRRTIPDLRTTAPETMASTQTNPPTTPTTTVTSSTQATKFVLDKTCIGKKCPPNSHCVVEHGIARCYCDTTFTLDKNGNCIGTSTQRPNVCGQLKCPKYAFCKDGVCMCQLGYVMSSQRCIASTQGRNVCTGVKCDENSRCVNGYCVCKSGSKYENGKCVGTKPSDDKCLDVKCPMNADCKRGYCFCKSQYFNFKGECRKTSAEKNPCDNVKCSDKAFCLKGRCQCTSGYSRTIDGKCRKVFLDNCANVKCSENEACNNGQCSCKSGYVRQKDGSCKKPTKDKCADIKCIENADCTKGYCFCKPGYTYANRKCNAINPCTTVKCATNSICVNGVCVCKKGYTKQKDGSCTAPALPPPANKCQRIKCPGNAVCKGGFCFCKFGYVQKSGKCVAVKTPKVCANMKCPENSQCRMDKCYCKSGYISSNKKCIRIGSNSCTRLNCGPHGRCVARNGRTSCEFTITGSQNGYRSQYSSTPKSCRYQCGKYDYARRCSCKSTCRQYGNCCADYRANCPGATHGYYYPTQG